MRYIEADALRRVVCAIFHAAGCSRQESERIAESLVNTNLAGHDSHGVIRISRYVVALRKGEVIPGRSVSVVSENEAMAVLDGNHGFGQTIGPQAVQVGIRKAQRLGLSVVALRHTAHIGRIGEWAELAAAAGLISVHFVNVPGSVLVAPFNGVERRMSTNPICIGVPVPGAAPIILDFATSIVAEGKVMVARSGGKALPPDALIDRDGSLSGDPMTLYGDGDTMKAPDVRDGSGAIRAFGDHKGSGLSLMCELLAGALSGGGTAAGKDYASVTNAMLSIYLAPQSFGDAVAFAGEVRRYVEFFKGSLPAQAGSEVLIPGEPEQRARQRRGVEGIPLEDAVWESLVESGLGWGLTRESLEALALPATRR